jgi:aryl-alcohol dehydrogenase-like predicted oxidoreductase
MNSVLSIELRPGYRISTIIKGGRQLAGGHGSVDSAAAIQDMAAFFDAGITTFDCADVYTGVEMLIGAFLQDLRRSRGASAAREARVHTKFMPDRGMLAGLTEQQVEAVIDRLLARLGLEQLDLVQFHWWDYETGGCLDALGYLALLQAKGKIRHLGLTNFDADHLEMFIRTGIDLASAQVQYSLLDRRPAGRFAELCHQHDIAILGYGALAGGFITDRWLGAVDPGHELKHRSLAKYRLIIDEFGGWALFQELLLALSAIATRHGVSIANVALRAMHDHNDLTAVILGARYADRLAENLRAFSFMPTERDREGLAAVLGKAKGPGGAVYGLERQRAGRRRRPLKTGQGQRIF